MTEIDERRTVKKKKAKSEESRFFFWLYYFMFFFFFQLTEFSNENKCSLLSFSTFRKRLDRRAKKKKEKDIVITPVGDFKSQLAGMTCVVVFGWRGAVAQPLSPCSLCFKCLTFVSLFPFFFLALWFSYFFFLVTVAFIKLLDAHTHTHTRNCSSSALYRQELCTRFLLFKQTSLLLEKRKLQFFFCLLLLLA